MIYLISRFFVLVAIAGMLGFGWLGQNRVIALYGALSFVGFATIELIVLGLTMRKASASSNGDSHSFLRKSGEWLAGAIVLSSLIAIIPESTRETGLIVWLGTVGSYIIMAPVLAFVGGIPIKWTYFGGWKILRRPGRRK